MFSCGPKFWSQDHKAATTNTTSVQCSICQKAVGVVQRDPWPFILPSSPLPFLPPSLLPVQLFFNFSFPSLFIPNSFLFLSLPHHPLITYTRSGEHYSSPQRIWAPAKRISAQHPKICDFVKSFIHVHKTFMQQFYNFFSPECRFCQCCKLFQWMRTVWIPSALVPF